VADLTINELIGWSHKNLGRFLGMNEHVLIIHTGKSAEVYAAVEFYRRVFLVSGACSIQHQLFLPADKSADLSASGAAA